MQFIKSFLSVVTERRAGTRRPFVTLSYAQSLDGCISARPGEALALSGRQSLTLTHQLRASHDAILVGIGTVLSDDPRLNVRLVPGTDPTPVVVDSRLRLPLDSRLLNQESRCPLVVTSEHPDRERKKALEDAGARLVSVPRNKAGQLNLAAMLDCLGDIGIKSIMVEGGSRIITNFLMERLANYIVLTVAPVLVGGLRAVSDLGQSDPANFLRIGNPGHKWLGDDLILWGDLA
ncbi:MAG TPA: RibD family protein [Desulfomonilaceae bacterium]|nr:RibD family protein [Desulfomonilaceae bacterium]